MSFLSLDAGVPDFKKAVISFWFRAPKASLKAAAASFDVRTYSQEWMTDIAPPKTIMAGIVPLVVFGKPQESTVWSAPPVVGGSYQYTTMKWQGPEDSGQFVVDVTQTEHFDINPVNPGATYPVNPCFIGVECVPAGWYSDGTPLEDLYVLKVNLQMAKSDRPDVTGYLMTLVGASVGSWVDFEYLSAPNYLFLPQSTNNYGAEYWDGIAQPIANPDEIVPIWTQLPKSSVDTSNEAKDLDPSLYYPEYFELGGYRSGPLNSEPTKLVVTPDQWHHVLISVDLDRLVSTHGFNWSKEGGQTVAEGTDSAAKAWIAFDGVNVDKEDLSQFWPKGLPDEAGYPDPNGILTPHAYAVATWMHNPDTVQYYNFWGTWLTIVEPTPMAEFSYHTKGVPSSGAPVGIPAPTQYSNNVRHVEMAEFQMWTGVTLDTSKPKNVALFLTSDKKPNTKYTGPSPGSPGCDDILGTPLVRLHGSGRWIKGMNTGTSGTASDGTQNPLGQFDPTGTINAFPKPKVQLGT